MTGRAPKLLAAAITAALALQAGPTFADATLYPTDDSYVRRTAPTTNFDEAGGTNPGPLSTTAQATIYSPNPFVGVPEDITYLRFDLSSWVGSSLSGATLRLWNRLPNGTGYTVAVYDPGSDDWNGAGSGLGGETSLTYNDAPSPLGGTFLDDNSQSSGAGAWWEFSSALLTSYVGAEIAGDGFVTFALRITTSGMSDLAYFEDHENTSGSGHEPELILQGDLAVEVVDLAATRVSEGVRLDWRTLSEHKHAGFRVLRGARDGHLELLTPQLIRNAGGSELGGAEYRFIDREAPLGATRYWIEDVDITGQGTRHGPVVAPAARIIRAAPPGTPPRSITSDELVH